MVSSRLLPPLPNDPAKTNWVEKAGGLPDYFVRVAKHIFYGGNGKYTLSEAIAGAESQTAKRAAKGNKEAIAAMTQWERMKAKSGKSTTKKLSNETITREKLLDIVDAYKIHKDSYTPSEQARITTYIRAVAHSMDT
jgi:hypothetical protein